MFPESTREDLAAGLDAVAMDLLERAGVETPPVNAFHLARQLGIAVARDDLQQGRTDTCGWPVHEPEWKREILRTEVEDCGVEAAAD